MCAGACVLGLWKYDEQTVAETDKDWVQTDSTMTVLGKVLKGEKTS